MKTETKFEIKKGKRTFAIFSSPLPFPLTFATHTRVVTGDPEGKVHRYEIHMFKNKKDPSQGYFYMDAAKPSDGLWKYARKKGPRHASKLLLQLSGKQGSLAHQVVTFIENNVQDYAYKHKYLHIPGPNCNSFTQRIVSQFPEIQLRLPRNAFGKGKF